MSNRGRGRGRGGRGRVGGRGKRPKRKKPSSSAAERTEDDDSSIELVVPPSRPSHPPSTSSTGGEEKKTYRKFEADDAAFRNTLIEQAAQDRIKAMRENPKNPGRLPRGFGSKQIEAFSKRAPTLRITESDIDNRRRLIAAKSKKGEADAQEERMPAARSIRATMSSALNTTASTLDEGDRSSSTSSRKEPAPRPDSDNPTSTASDSSSRGQENAPLPSASATSESASRSVPSIESSRCASTRGVPSTDQPSSSTGTTQPTQRYTCSFGDKCARPLGPDQGPSNTSR